MAKCGAKSSPTCRCCTPSKEGEKGSVIRICPKVPNLYIRLPLLAYITEFQILPSVYDAVKKTGLFRWRCCCTWGDWVWCRNIVYSCYIYRWNVAAFSECCFAAWYPIVWDERSIRYMCLILLSMLSHIREMSMTQEHTIMLRESPGLFCCTSLNKHAA